MDNLKYTHTIKKDNYIGKLDVYEDMLNIVTNQTSRKIEFSFIKSIFLSEINKKDFEIELKNNEIVHLQLIDSENERFDETYNYLNSLIGSNKEPLLKNKQPIDAPETHYFKTEVNETQDNGSNNSLPILISASTIVNKNLLNVLSNETFLKQNLNYINKINLTSDGQFGLYDTYINIDNPYFELNLPYTMLQNVYLHDTLETKFTINLYSGASFDVIPKYTDNNKIQQIYQILQYNINNSMMNNIQQMPIQNNQMMQQQYPTQSYQPNYQQPIYNQMPMNKKSTLVAVILHVLLIGLGYAYMNKWGKFLVVLLIALFCVATIIFVIPAFILVILWIYVLIDTITMVNKYNNGEPY